MTIPFHTWTAAAMAPQGTDSPRDIPCCTRGAGGEDELIRNPRSGNHAGFRGGTPDRQSA